MRLFKRGRSQHWYARIRVGDRVERWSTGTPDAEEAERRAQARERALAGEAAASSASTPAPSSPPPAPPGPTRAEEIAAKLRALGRANGVPAAATPALPPAAVGEDAGGEDEDAAAGASSGPAEADKIIPPGETDSDQAAGADNGEADDLFADVIAHAVVSGTVRIVTTRLARRRPPEKPGEPHEKSLAWYHEGLSHRCRKIMGSGKLGPDAKMVVGFAGVVLSMYVGATPIDPAAAAAAAASSPPPAPAQPAPHDEDEAPAPAPRAAPTTRAALNGAAMGRF